METHSGVSEDGIKIRQQGLGIDRPSLGPPDQWGLDGTVVMAPTFFVALLWCQLSEFSDPCQLSDDCCSLQ